MPDSKQPPDMTPKPAMIFDFDGVIADSLPLLYQAYCDLLESYGHAGSLADFVTLNGAKISEIASRLQARYQLPATAEAIENAFRVAISTLPARLRPMAGAQDLLNTLAFLNVPMALATSSPREYFEPFLVRQGLISYFRVIVCGEDVAHAKPDPEIYRLAMSRLQVTDAWVVEDAMAGILAAKGAGARAIQLFSPWEPAATAERADLSIAELSALVPELLSLDAEGCQVLALAQQISVEFIETAFTIDVAPDVIAREWSAACQARPHLFDSQISVYHSHDWQAGQLIVRVQPGCYRDFLVASRLGLNYPALGVSGVIQDATGAVLLGQRDVSCTEYPGYWECAPAGGLPFECATWQEALLQEAVEETSLRADQIQHIQPIGLFKDGVNGVYDIAACLQVSSLEQISAGQEYQKLRICDPDVEQGSQNWVPLSKTLLAVLNWSKEVQAS